MAYFDTPELDEPPRAVPLELLIDPLACAPLCEPVESLPPPEIPVAPPPLVDGVVPVADPFELPLTLPPLVPPALVAPPAPFVPLTAPPWANATVEPAAMSIASKTLFVSMILPVWTRPACSTRSGRGRSVLQIQKDGAKPR